MGKLLLVTGAMAEAETTDVAVGLHADVAVFPVSVALFITPESSIKGLKELDLRIYEKIIFPGLMPGDLSEIEKGVGVPCFKGTVQVSDLPRALKKGVELSRTEAIEATLEKDAKAELGRVLKGLEAKEAGFRIGKLKIGNVPRLLAEVIDVPRLDKQDIINQALHYKETGADMIDIGAVAGGGNGRKLAGAVGWVKEATGLPVSIDSLDPDEIKAGIDAGAELVLSLDSSNIGKVDIPGDVACVILPTDVSKGGMPAGKGRIDALLANIEAAKEIGLRKLLADPILEPAPRFAESLKLFSEFKERSDIPLFMGVGNVIELIDADSIGMNALLASAGVELGVAVFLTTEASPKTTYAVRELKRGLDMALLARAKKTVPKDLGLCLLTAKGKKRAALPELPEEFTEAGLDTSFKTDPKGNFHICVDFGKKKIVAAHFTDEYDDVMQGDTAEAVWKGIEKKGLVSDKSHAAYLGRELQKAEDCLRSGKSYIQD